MQYPVKAGSWPTVQPEDWRTIRPEMDSPEGPKDATADASRRSRSTRELEETIARLHCEIIKDESARDASLWRFRVWGVAQLGRRGGESANVALFQTAYDYRSPDAERRMSCPTKNLLSANDVREHRQRVQLRLALSTRHQRAGVDSLPKSNHGRERELALA